MHSPVIKILKAFLLIGTVIKSNTQTASTHDHNIAVRLKKGPAIKIKKLVNVTNFFILLPIYK